MAPKANRRSPGLAAVARILGLFVLALLPAAAQSEAGMREILARLDRLEAQNRALAAKVEALQAELATARAGATPAAPAAGPSLEERMQVEETRTAEQQQAKVEASQKFPIRITGMALFNAYRNSEYSGGSAFPVIAAPGGSAGGATFRQTVLGLDYFGPTTIWNGKISGSLRMDFFGGSGHLLDQTFRLRTASIAIDWKTRGIRAAMDKPLLATREPESLAQVGVSALTAAGNLWFWLPQARFEQVFRFSENSGIRAQAAAVETNEAGSASGTGYYAPGGPPVLYLPRIEPYRPGAEGRVEFFSGADRRIEIASGFHHSIAHASGRTLPTTIYSADWLARFAPAFEFTGTVFTGTNTAALGGLQQGIVLLGRGIVRAVHSTGGWGQLTWRPASRLWFNFFTGEEDPRNRDLPAGYIARNLAYGANIFVRLSPNVLTSFETYQYRTTYLPGVTLLSNHYDLALAYQF